MINKLPKKKQQIKFISDSNIKIEDNKYKPSNTLFNHYIINIRKTKINSSQKKFDLFPNNSVNINNSYNPNKFNTKLIEHLSPKDFICLAKLGEGSFGIVYLVEKINTKEKYAMKVLNKEKIIDQNIIRYIVTERNIMSNINHPFLVKLKYAFQTSYNLFLITEYCPNGDLSQHLNHEKRFKEPRVKFYICELILALEYLHKKDIIFRDVKPENVLLDKDGHIKLTDFGLSKEGITDNFYTKTFCGSIGYTAPEIIQKKKYGKSVDWYLLGVLFYELLTGIIPFYSTNDEEMFRNIQRDELKIHKIISKEAAGLIKQLMEKNPDKRLGGAGRDALEIKEHPYFKDVNWNEIYEKKIKPPNFFDFKNKYNKSYCKNKKFLNECLNDKSKKQSKIKGWSFIANDEI